MNASSESDPRLTDEGVRADLQRQPHLMLKLAENALSVAENLRDNYFRNTTTFIKHLRKRVYGTSAGGQEPILTVHRVDDIDWSALRGEVVTFIDGGIGGVELSNQVPVLLRVGSYSVRPGERQLAEREHFGYYPVIFGDLEGGSKERKDFPDIVRITAELLGGLSAVERTPDLRVLMFHGPLVYMMGAYAGHTPFTEKDIDLFLQHYAADPKRARELKEDFLHQARLDIYPKLTPSSSDQWADRRIFEPLSWIAFLYRRLMAVARSRKPVPIIAGVVERGGTLRQFSETVLLERVFRGLRKRAKQHYFNEMYGRKDLTSPKALLDRLGYTDALLLGMLLRPGEASEPWSMDKYSGLRRGDVALPGESHEEKVDFSPLAHPNIGFPHVTGFYVHVSETTEPIRVEVFTNLGEEQVHLAAERSYLYARLLPQYGFPVGLDIADKHAKVPAWMTDAYAKLIRHHLGVSLQRGEITDAELRRILVQAIYMTHRDWLFRPKV
jgi:hypothetical protein